MQQLRRGTVVIRRGVPAVLLAVLLVVGAMPVTAGADTAPTVLSPITAPSTDFVGNTLTLSTTLTRTSAPTGPVAGATVVFSVTTFGPSGTTVTLSDTTDAAGLATVVYPLTVRGDHHIEAEFDGDAAHSGSDRSADTTVHQRTALILNNAHGDAGEAITVVAGLTAVPGGAPIAGQTVSFDFGGEVPSGAAVTNAAGLASITRTFPNPGTFAATASFLNVAEFFVDQDGAPIATVSGASVTVGSVITDVEIVSDARGIVGEPLILTGELSRVTVPTGPIGGALLSFTVTQPGGGQFLQSVATDSSGLASVSFTPSVRGAHLVTIDYAGTIANLPSSDSETVFVDQTTSLSLAPVTGVAGAPTTVAAVLTTLPLPGTAVAGKAVTFSFGGAVPNVTATTDGAGVASASVSFPASGTFPVTASFDAIDSYLASSAASSATINQALSALSSPVVAPGLVGQGVSMSTTLTRVSAPTGPVAGATIAFGVTDPDGSLITVFATTDGAGTATAAFTPTKRGVHSVTASFGGNAALATSTSIPTTTTVHQRTALAVDVATFGRTFQPLPASADLTTVPGGSAVAGQTVTFVLRRENDGAIVATLDAVTNAAGRASVAFSAALAVVDSAYTVTASFLNGADHFTNAAGAVPPVATTASAVITLSSDATPPTIDLRTPVDGAAYGLGSTVIADFDCADLTGPGHSGLASCVGTVADGAAIDTSTVGNHTFTVTAADNVGNTTTRSVTYKVVGATKLVAKPVISITDLLRLRVTLDLEARLTTLAGGAPIAGQTIQFSAGGSAVCTGVTDGNGVARCTGIVPLLRAILALSYQASYGGTPLYLPSWSAAPLLGV